ncbi:MAG: succinate dehydrogenase assembly factor 2 [Gammaproteobacteria bacterium]
MDAKRLRWRCRRGMRELDIVLNRFLEHDFEHLDPAQCVAFSALLEIPDAELYAWLLQRRSPLPEFESLLACFRRHLHPL